MTQHREYLLTPGMSYFRLQFEDRLRSLLCFFYRAKVKETFTESDS